jgi:hypothetical protein
MQKKKESPLENFFWESSEASEAIREGDRVRVNLTTGEIFDLSQKKKFFCENHPDLYAGFDQGWRIDSASSKKKI